MSDIEKDKYQLELDKKKIALKKCQEEMNLKSCMDCSKLFECTIRKNYVNSAYASMSKGQTGGFEF